MDTVARDSLGQVTGTRRIDGLAPTAAYLELLLNSGAYLTKPVIYIREKAMRQAISNALTGPDVARFQETHRIAPASLLDRQAAASLLASGRAEAPQVKAAGATQFLHQLVSELSMRPEFRLPLERLSVRMGAFVSGGGDPTVSGQWYLAAEDPEESIDELSRLWRRRDASGINSLCRRLRDDWPSATTADRGGGKWKGDLELLYNRCSRPAVLPAGFAASLLLMIFAAASPSRWARRAGLAILSMATVGLLSAFVVRWLLSGRAWYLPPIMNQYEAVVGSVLLGSLAAIFLELTCKRNYFAIAASAYAVVALLAQMMFPQQMSPAISATHGILNSPVMAVHVAVIIVGHALAGMTLVISLAYLAVATRRAISGRRITSSSPDLTASTGTGALETIDRCNLIVAQLACWTIVVGTILGAYWADFAWGRWWGWDPKETWALMTALVYVAVVHLRFVTPSRYRGMATALGCILGCGVMAFNWTVVNFIIVGKHSYA